MKKKTIRVTSVQSVEETLPPLVDDQLFTAIKSHYLAPQTKIEFDIYTKEKNIYLLLYRSGHIIDKAFSFEATLKHDFFVLSKDLKAYHDYVNKNISMIVNNKALHLDDRSKVVYHLSSDIIGNVFKDPLSPQNIKRSENVVRAIVDIVLSNDKALRSLMKVTEHDFMTHTHCVHVAIYAINIAQSMDFTQEELCEIGTAAILHDLGKTEVDTAIINKPGRLTLKEYLTMQIHPERGYHLAKKLGIDNDHILNAIHNHHEKADGTGYPQKLKSNHISIYAQIISIADVFDALTTKRPYKEALSTFEALKTMKDEFSDHLNMNILSHFIRHLYAIGQES